MLDMQDGMRLFAFAFAFAEVDPKTSNAQMA